MTTQASVTVPVKGEVKVGINQVGNPTPNWMRQIVRSLAWATAAFALFTTFFDFKDLGMNETLEIKILRIAASVTGLVSVLARFVGVDTPSFFPEQRSPIQSTYDPNSTDNSDYIIK